MKVNLVSKLPKADAIAILVPEGALKGAAKTYDNDTGGAVQAAMKASRFAGKPGQVSVMMAPNGVAADRLCLVGIGKVAKLDGHGFEKAIATLVKNLLTSGAKHVAVVMDGVSNKNLSEADLTAHGGMAARLAAYRFDQYRTTQKDDQKPTLATITFAVEDLKAAKAAWTPMDKVCDGVIITRDLVSEPANVLTPPEFAKRAKALSKLGLKVEVLGEKEMTKLGMNALLGVGQGSRQESHLAIMKWTGAKDKKAKPIAFVGKGVCFDTGGISLKPPQGMWDMIWDMGGAGVVTGLMAALAGRKAKVNAVGIIGLVENMPDGNAQRPGDVVKSMSGQTIEVLNTDAEGRLVLADAMTYCKEKFDPTVMIDLATLTGAMLVSLGHDVAGVFTDSDKLAKDLFKAGEVTGDDNWHLPMPDLYDKMIDSKVADVKNIGEGRLAGSITAAMFLKRFVGDTEWAHIDIAGTTHRPGSKDPRNPTGASGYGVRLLNQYVMDVHEDA